MESENRLRLIAPAKDAERSSVKGDKIPLRGSLRRRADRQRQRIKLVLQVSKYLIFRPDGCFVPVALFQENVLRELFEANVYKLPVAEGLITAELISKMRTRKHSGFHAYAGPNLISTPRAAK